MSVQKLLDFNALSKTSYPYQSRNIDRNFVKQSFNFENANPNKPNGIVCDNPLTGYAPKGTNLYILG